MKFQNHRLDLCCSKVLSLCGCLPTAVCASICCAGHNSLLCEQFLLRSKTPLLPLVSQQGAWPMWLPAPSSLRLTCSVGHNLMLCRILYCNLHAIGLTRVAETCAAHVAACSQPRSSPNLFTSRHSGVRKCSSPQLLRGARVSPTWQSVHCLSWA